MPMSDQERLAAIVLDALNKSGVVSLRWRTSMAGVIANRLIAAGVTMPTEITTTEQLDALPFLTVIREVRQQGRDAVDYGGVYERRTSGWQCISGTWAEATRNGPPSLPVRVLWQGVAQ